MKRPNFFIVGAPKCGTTSLYHYLRQHPEIFMPERKEPHFFCSDLEIVPQYALDKRAYLELFAPATTESSLGEACIWNLYSTCAARNISRFNPDARIIIMLRDPVDMAYSLHSQHLYAGFEYIADFRAALDAEESRRRDVHPRPGLPMPQGALYREMGRYAQQVERYISVFDRRQVHFVIYDDFAKDPGSAYRDVLHFLGVAPDVPIVPNNHNPNKRYRSQLLRRAMRTEAVSRRLVRLLLPPPCRLPLRRFVQGLNTRVVARPPLPPDLERALRAEFAPDVARLGALLGRDLSHWTRPGAVLPAMPAHTRAAPTDPTRGRRQSTEAPARNVAS